MENLQDELQAARKAVAARDALHASLETDVQAKLTALSAVLDPLLATAEADEARLEEINQVAQAPSPEPRVPRPEP